MKIQFGYVSIATTLTNITASSTLTYTRYKQMDFKDRLTKLDLVIQSNFTDLKKILKYNVKNDIHFYRMTSKLIPLMSHPEANISLTSYKQEFLEIGTYIKKNNIRLDTHPDQFCVLNSSREDVVKNSIRILNDHALMFDLMEYPGKIIIHVGSSVDGKEVSLTRFKENFKKLKRTVKAKIIIENDDKVFTMVEVLKLCQELNVPMVLDVHHHNCNHDGEKIGTCIEEIFNTWGNETPKIHFSSPKGKQKKDVRSHHDYIDPNEMITFIEQVKFINRDFDIMLEAKQKDEALFRLIRQLKYYSSYKIKKNTIFL